MEKTDRKTGGIAKFQEMSKDWENNPKILRKVIENMSEKIDELQAKAKAYDRIMSGGKKTLKEWANILGRVVVVNGNGIAESFAGKPTIDLRYCFWYIDEDDDDYEDDRFIIPKECVEFDGDWTQSLTLPDKVVWEATK